MNKNKQKIIHDRYQNEAVIIEQIKQYGEEIFQTSLHQPIPHPSKKKLITQYRSPYSRETFKKQSISSSKRKQKMSKTIRDKVIYFKNQCHFYQKARDERMKSNKSYDHIQPKYNEKKSMISNLENQVKKKFYGKDQPKNEQKWNAFLQKQQQWNKNKKNQLIKSKVEQITQNSHKKSSSTVDECIIQLRNQTNKLQEKLQKYTLKLESKKDVSPTQRKKPITESKFSYC